MAKRRSMRGLKRVSAASAMHEVKADGFFHVRRRWMAGPHGFLPEG
jgi:hypothetical protein